MDKPGIDARGGLPLYHWAEWPLATLTAVLLAAALWSGPGAPREWIVFAFKAASLALCCWSIYLEWRQGGLGRSFSGIYQGMRSGEHTFLWMHRRTPLRLVWMALMVLGWWHL